MKTASNQKKKKAPSYHHGNLRPVLIDQAARLAAHEGLQHVSLRRVAQAAKVSHAAPYHHFKNKSDLMAAVADEGFKRLDQAMARAVARCPKDAEVGERLAAMGKAYVRFAQLNAHYFGIMFRPELSEAAEPAPDSWSTRAFERLVRTVQEALGAASPDSELVLTEVLHAWSLVHGLSSLWTDGALKEMPPFSDWGINRCAELVIRRSAAGRS